MMAVIIGMTIIIVLVAVTAMAHVDEVTTAEQKLDKFTRRNAVALYSVLLQCKFMYGAHKGRHRRGEGMIHVGEILATAV